MLGTGLHPRLAHMLLRASGGAQRVLAARLAALLSERDLLRGARDPDLRTRLALLDGQSHHGHAHHGEATVDRGALQRVRQLAARLASDARTASGNASPVADDAQAGLLLAWAFPDRIAQRREGGGSGPKRYLLSNGRGAQLEQVSTLSNSAWLVAVELDDAEGSEAKIRLGAPIEPSQLEHAMAAQIHEEDETGVDPRTGALRARRVRRLGALEISSRRLEVDADIAAALLLDELHRDGIAALPWGPLSRTLRARIALVTAAGATTAVRDVTATGEPPAAWPSFTDADLLTTAPQWLLPALHGQSRLTALGDRGLHDALLSRLSHAQRRRLDEWTPLHLTVPTGTRVDVDYLDDNAPCIAVRLQEVFGLADTPRLAAGRVPVTLKLLSPARRPVQVTRDLAGFWRGSYADVRKDMRGRYPKHYWPENPLQAEPTRGVRPR
jgi:ATP-dependent helicase HrpB